MKRINPTVTRLGYVVDWSNSVKKTNSVLLKRFVLFLDIYLQKKITNTGRSAIRRLVWITQRYRLKRIRRKVKKEEQLLKSFRLITKRTLRFNYLERFPSLYAFYIPYIKKASHKLLSFYRNEKKKKRYPVKAKSHCRSRKLKKYYRKKRLRKLRRKATKAKKPPIMAAYKQKKITSFFLYTTRRKFATTTYQQQHFQKKSLYLPKKSNFKKNHRLLKKKKFDASYIKRIKMEKKDLISMLLIKNHFYRSRRSLKKRYLRCRKFDFLIFKRRSWLRRRRLFSISFFNRWKKLYVRRINRQVRFLKARHAFRRSRSIKIMKLRFHVRRRFIFNPHFVFFRVRRARFWNKKLWVRRFKKRRKFRFGRERGFWKMKKPSFVARKRFRRRLFLRHRVVSKYFVGVFRNRQHLEKKKTTVNGKRFNKATLYVKSDWSSMFVKKNRRLFKKKKSVRRRFSEIFKKKHRRAFFFRKQHYRRRFKRRRINKFCKYKRKLFGRLAWLKDRRSKRYRKFLIPFFRNFKYRSLINGVSSFPLSISPVIRVEFRNIQPLLFSNVRLLRIFYQLTVYKKLTSFYPNKLFYSFFSTILKCSLQWRNIFLFTSSLALEFKRTRFHYRFFKIFDRFLKLIIMPQFTLTNLVIRVRGCFGKISRTRAIFLKPLERYHIPDNLNNVWRPVLFSFKHVSTYRGIFSIAVWLA